MQERSTRILVIEDEPAHAEAIRRSLEFMEGAELRIVGSLREFRDGVADWRPDLALMDLNLPDGRAMEVLPDPADTRTFPIVLMTSFGSERIAVEAMKAGAFDYLVKSPETFGGLARTVERQLREWHDRQDRKRAEQALRDSEERFRTLTESSPDAILRFDREGRHSYANPTALGLLGLAGAAVVGRTPREAGLAGPVCDLWEERIGRVLASGNPERFEFSHEAPGGTLHFDTRLTPERDGEGRVRFVLGVSRDITEGKRAEEERRVLSAQLQQVQKMESLGSLAGGVAHDLNNVLGAILGLATAHLDIHPPDSAAHKAFGSITRAAHRGGGTLRSLLNFARQSPNEELELDLNDLLREEVRLLERTTLARVRLTLDLAEGLPPIKGDAGALTHAFMNLCVNAVDAMPEGGSLTLRTLREDPGWVQVAVEDDGAGMAPAVLARAMDPFFTTKPEGKGTGLGLAMVYSAVKAHQGHMDIRSEPGEGTRVVLRFPVCAGGKAVPVPESPRTRLPGRSLGVLVVDDDELIQETVQAVLESLGHHATPAFRGEEALAMLEAGFQPDVVILDVNMPGLGGKGTLPRLRALRPSLPVLLSTGRADQASVDLARAHEGVTLLPKPFTKRELQDLLLEMR